MHALLALMALMAGAAAAAWAAWAAWTNWGLLPRLMLVNLVAAIPFILKYRRRIYVVAKTLPRDIRFLYRYCYGMIRSKKWDHDNETVSSLFTKRAIKYPKSLCIICEGKSWTFEEVERYSNKVAQVFWTAGLRRGDVVCVFMPNCAEYICVWLGLSKLGVISALINSNLRYQPLIHCINVAKARAMVFEQSLAEDVFAIEDSLGDLPLYCLGDFKGKTTKRINSLVSLLDEMPPLMPPIVTRPNYKDCLLYIYTSGTTGMPKAAVIPNSKYLLVVVATVHMLGLKWWDNNKIGDIMYNPLPLYHTAGGIVGTGAALVDGIPTVIRPKFSASNYWSDCIKYKCTVAQYIGEMCRYLLAQPHRPEDSKHSVRIMVGNGMRHAIWQDMVDRFKIAQVNEVYGATEGNANIINVDNTVGAVGFVPSLLPVRLHPIAVIKVDATNEPIRGPDGFCVRCAPNEPGMFIGLISQGNASREYHGYIDKEDSDKKILTNVFRKGEKAFLSGDILVMDEMGYLFFKDRTGDSFKWKGENVSTAEVEGIILNITGNCACIVYGVSIPMVEGRAGMAAIAIDDKQDLDLARLAAGLDRMLPSFARPLFLRIMKDIEITGTFKLKKLSYTKEGFDPDVTKDAIYFRTNSKVWQPMTTQLYNDICQGRVKL